MVQATREGPSLLQDSELSLTKSHFFTFIHTLTNYNAVWSCRSHFRYLPNSCNTGLPVILVCGSCIVLMSNHWLSECVTYETAVDRLICGLLHLCRARMGVGVAPASGRPQLLLSVHWFLLRSETAAKPTNRIRTHCSMWEAALAWTTKISKSLAAVKLHM